MALLDLLVQLPIQIFDLHFVLLGCLVQRGVEAVNLSLAFVKKVLQRLNLFFKLVDSGVPIVNFVFVFGLELFDLCLELSSELFLLGGELFDLLVEAGVKFCDVLILLFEVLQLLEIFGKKLNLVLERIYFLVPLLKMLVLLVVLGDDD